MGTPLHDSKDGDALDWYTEGPRRKVGYDDLTAIDWIFEYTKERQRLRMLYTRATGIFGYAQQLLDASQVWLVLISTGLASGILAAGIDIASDWLGDLKTGYCRNGAGGGRFYLNKGFCCWGHEGKHNWKQQGETTDPLSRVGPMFRLDSMEYRFTCPSGSWKIYCRVPALHRFFGIISSRVN